MKEVFHEYLKKARLSGRYVCVEHKDYLDEPLVILIKNELVLICPQCAKEEYGHAKEPVEQPDLIDYTGGWVCKNCSLDVQHVVGGLCDHCYQQLTWVPVYYEFTCAHCQVMVYLEEGSEEVVCGPCLEKHY